MFTTCRSILNIILLLALTGSMLYNYLHRCKPKSGVISSVTPGGPLATPILDTYRDDEGREHVVIDPDASVQIRQRAAQVAAPIVAKMDSLAAALAIMPKQIEGYTAVVMAASYDSVRFLKRTVDSLKRQTFYYKDKYFSLRVRASDAADTTALANSFDFTYDADLKFVDYSKRDRILGIPVGRRRYFTDISSSDPRMRIRGVEKFTFLRRTPPFGLRLQALASYNMATMNYSAGMGLRFDAGDRFNAGFNYTYNFGSGTWTPIIFTKYDIVQLGR